MRVIYIHREIEKKIKTFLKQFPVVILTGPRQTGKSTTLKEVFVPRYKYISLEEPTIRENILSDPKLFLDTLPDRVILDEIQYIPELLPYLKMKVDENRTLKGKFILTGSQQFQMMKNVTETLAGRTGLLRLLPFSYVETKEIFLKKYKLNPLKIFIHTCLRGSYPEIFIHNKYDARAWYDSYIQTYLERDIRNIYNIGNLRDFHRFLRLLASRCSQILNLSNIASDLGVAVNTVKNWLSILEASYIIYLLPPYYKNIGKRITKSPKIYFTDCGLLCHLLNIKKENELLNHPLLGAIFENYCIQETVKLFENEGLRPEIYYLRTKTGKEIDLILEVTEGVYPIEIKFTKTPTLKTIEPLLYFYREIKKIKLLKGFLFCLVDTKSKVTKDISALNIDSYIEEICKII